MKKSNTAARRITSSQPLQPARALEAAADSLACALACRKAALDGQALDIVVLDVRRITPFADYFVIMCGRSTRHVQALAGRIEKELLLKRSVKGEGRQEGLWILLDLGDVIVHIFYQETRDFYRLEELWHDAPRIADDDGDVPQDAT